MAFNSSLGGLEPAFYLQDGFPQDFTPPPFIQSDFANGQGIYYRALNGNERSRSQQWNITVDRQLSPGFTVSLAYVGSHGTRIFSSNVPLNALDPKYLSLGDALYDEFQPGDTSLHGVPVPYDGWIEQMQSCPPSLAQALLPYPQYCSGLLAMNENEGKSTYHSFQAKVEKRLLPGLVPPRLLHPREDDDERHGQRPEGRHQLERGDRRHLAVRGGPQLGPGHRRHETHPLGGARLGHPRREGKEVRGQGRARRTRSSVAGSSPRSSGTRRASRSSSGPATATCPGEFRAGCIPSSTGNVFAQDMGSFDPNKGPLFNVNAFTPVDAFNFYWGNGPRISDIRGFSYKNQDLSLIKNTKLWKDVNLQLRVEAFNVWNWHNFTQLREHRQRLGFQHRHCRPDFGVWSGAVTPPRVIQLAARLEF